MNTIDHFNLRSFDLNLLIAFDALVETGSVTKAAQRLKIQQPAMSHSLATLRILLEDPLFVRVGHVMQPTPRARAFATPVRNILRQAQETLTAVSIFDPATEERTFRLALSPEADLLLLPELTRHLCQIAPGIRLLSRTAAPEQVDGLLGLGEVDLAIGCINGSDSRHTSEKLYEAEVMCCFKEHLLALDNPLGLDDYLGAKHAVITHTDSLHGCIRDALQFSGIDLDVVVASPDFVTVLSAATISPVIATVPSRIAESFAPLLGLAVSPAPVKLVFPPVSMTWSIYADSDQANMWLRRQIRLVLGMSFIDVSQHLAVS